MATYKVIQDVEAEDKILGPLTLRQFIYAGMAAICLYLTYFVINKGAGFMAAAFLPIALITGFFAFPWGRDQPTEIWALAKIRFMLKPRRRVWDQSAIKELVTITAPKKEAPNYATKNLSQNEVRSRLHALADTLDSRGWAIKNATINLSGQAPLSLGDPNSDRLVGMGALPQQQQVADVDIRAADDIMDEQNNPVAQQMNTMIEASAKAHRQKIVDSLNQSGAPAQPQAPANNYWFLNQPAQPTTVPDNMVTFNTQVVTPGMEEEDLTVGAPANPTPDEENLVEALKANQGQAPMAAYYGHLHTIQPLSQPTPTPKPQTPAPVQAAQPAVSTPANIPQPAAAQAVPTSPAATPQPAQPQVTPAQQAAILQLANNDDLNVATIAREAKRSGPQDDEVVIKLR
jgi:hypothetical protein